MSTACIRRSAFRTWLDRLF